MSDIIWTDWSDLEGLLPGLRRYVEDHIRTGDFLYACLTNNLEQAVQRADWVNKARLEVIVEFLMELPSECWGSVEKVEAWLAAKSVRANAKDATD